MFPSQCTLINKMIEKKVSGEVVNERMVDLARSKKLMSRIITSNFLKTYWLL